MIDFSGRAVRAGTRSISVVAAISCFAALPQLAHAATGSTARKHNHDVSRRDHDRRNGHGRANLVVDTKGPQGAILPGRTYKWPYEVTNKGSLPARNVVLAATPDKSLKVLAVPPKCHWQHGSRLFCKIGLLPQGETKRGEITAAVAPKVRTAKSLISPVQVTWRNAPVAETRRTTAFPPGTSGKAGGTDPVPYPVMQTERGPRSSEAVVVRSSVSPYAPVGPCALILPARVAGKTRALKPAAGTCDTVRNAPRPIPASAASPGKQGGARCALEPGTHEADVPSCATAGQAAAPCAAEPSSCAPAPDRAVTPCAAAKPATEAKAEVPPCAAGGPGACACRPAPNVVFVPQAPVAVPDRPALTPCEAAAKAAEQPVVPAVPPCAAAQGWTVKEQPARTPCQARKPVTEDGSAVPPCAVGQGWTVKDRPALTPCEAAKAAEQPVVPAVPPCAAAQGTATQDRPAAPRRPATGVVVVPGAPDAPEAPKAPKAPDTPAAPVSHTSNEHAAPVVPDAPKAPEAPNATDVIGAPGTNTTLPCGAVAEKPVAAQDVPVTSPCAGASGIPAACGCVAAQDRPVVHPDVPVVAPGAEGVTPCSALADKPMATRDEAGQQAAPSCAGEQAHPVVVPGKSAITPLAGVGKTEERPEHHVMGRPADDPVILPGHFPGRRHHAEAPWVRVPRGRAHRGCLAQGTGFICPLGSMPRGGHHIRPAMHARPAGRPEHFQCGGGGAACHTRMARPVASRPNVTVRRLPSTGTSSALLALSGLGLAGAGVALYRFGRTRRSEEG